MTNLGKVVLGIGSAGAIGGGIGYGVYSFGNQQGQSSLKYKLTSEGFDTNVNDEEWAEILVAHEASKNKFTIPTDVTDKKSWLKEHCKELLKKENESSYSKAMQWCVKKEKIVNILKKNGKFRALNTGKPITDEEKALWKEKITALKLPANNVAKESLSALLQGPNDEENIEELQGKCKEVTNTETITEKFENNLTLSQEWCSIGKEP